MLLYTVLYQYARCVKPGDCEFFNVLGLLDITNNTGVFLGKFQAQQGVLSLVFQVAQTYGDCIRKDGWSALLKTIVRMAKLDVLPPAMCQLDDFAGGNIFHRLVLCVW